MAILDVWVELLFDFWFCGVYLCDFVGVDKLVVTVGFIGCVTCFYLVENFVWRSCGFVVKSARCLACCFDLLIVWFCVWMYWILNAGWLFRFKLVCYLICSFLFMVDIGLFKDLKLVFVMLFMCCSRFIDLFWCWALNWMTLFFGFGGLIVCCVDVCVCLCLQLCCLVSIDWCLALICLLMVLDFDYDVYVCWVVFTWFVFWLVRFDCWF